MLASRLIVALVATVATVVGGDSTDPTEESFIPNFAVGKAHFGWADDVGFSDGDGTMAFSEFGVNANFPILFNDTVKFTGGVRYRFNQIDFQGAPAPVFSDTLDLHRIDIPFNVWIDQGERWKWWLSLQPGLASDFGSIDFDDMTVTALALASFKVNDSLKVAFGGYYSNDLGKARLLPAIGAIYRPNKHWILSLTVPRGEIAWAPTQDWLIAVRAYPSGGGWNVSNPAGGDSDFNYASIKGSLGVERRFGKRIWGFVESGVRFAQNVELEEASPRFDHDLDQTFFIDLGVKVRF